MATQLAEDTPRIARERSTGHDAVPEEHGAAGGGGAGGGGAGGPRFNFPRSVTDVFPDAVPSDQGPRSVARSVTEIPYEMLYEEEVVKTAAFEEARRVMKGVVQEMHGRAEVASAITTLMETSNDYMEVMDSHNSQAERMMYVPSMGDYGMTPDVAVDHVMRSTSAHVGASATLKNTRDAYTSATLKMAEAQAFAVVTFEVLMAFERNWTDEEMATFTNAHEALALAVANVEHAKTNNTKALQDWRHSERTFNEACTTALLQLDAGGAGGAAGAHFLALFRKALSAAGEAGAIDKARAMSMPSEAAPAPKKARKEAKARAVEERFKTALLEQSEAGAIDKARAMSMPSAAGEAGAIDKARAMSMPSAAAPAPGAIDKARAMSSSSSAAAPGATDPVAFLHNMKTRTFGDASCVLVMYCAAERNLAVSNLPAGYILHPEHLTLEEMQWFLAGCQYKGNEALVGSMKRRRILIDTREYVESYYVHDATFMRVQKYGEFKIQATYLVDGEMF